MICSYVLVLSAALLASSGATTRGGITTAMPNPQPTETGPSLEGNDWTLTELGGEAIAASMKNREPHLNFAKDETRVTGSTGCNTLTGRYERVGEQLTLGPLAVTRMMCQENAELEKRFLAALNQVAAYRIIDSRLELHDEKGQVLALFERRP